MTSQRSFHHRHNNHHHHNHTSSLPHLITTVTTLVTFILCSCLLLGVVSGRFVPDEPKYDSFASCLLIPVFEAGTEGNDAAAAAVLPGENMNNVTLPQETNSTLIPSSVSTTTEAAAAPPKKRPSLSWENTGTIKLFYDTSERKEPELRGTLPSDLQLAKHGFHVHEWGDLRSATSQGGHFAGKKDVTHELPPTVPRHIGDMGNVGETKEIDLKGKDDLLWTLDRAEMRGIVGRSIVLHAKQDTGEDPSGNSGARLYHCVVGIANVSSMQPKVEYNAATAPSMQSKLLVAEMLPVYGDWNRLHGRVAFEETEFGGIKVKAKICGLYDTKSYALAVHLLGDLLGDSHVERVGPVLKEYNDVGESVGNVGGLQYNAQEKAWTYESTNQILLLDSLPGRSVVMHEVPRSSNSDEVTDTLESRSAAGVIGFANDKEMNIDSPELFAGLECK